MTSSVRLLCRFSLARRPFQGSPSHWHSVPSESPVPALLVAESYPSPYRLTGAAAPPSVRARFLRQPRLTRISANTRKPRCPLWVFAGRPSGKLTRTRTGAREPRGLTPETL
jgi:hypothetical protein